MLFIGNWMNSGNVRFTDEENYKAKKANPHKFYVIGKFKSPAEFEEFFKMHFNSEDSFVWLINYINNQFGYSKREST